LNIENFICLAIQYVYRKMKKIDKEDVLDDITSCFGKHGEVNRRIFNEDSDFCSGKTVYNKFGSFSEACRKAGVPHNNKPQKKDKVEIKCNQCGEKRNVYPYRAEKQFPNGTSETCKFCMDKKVVTSCSWCGSDIEKHRYLVDAAENNFCDHKCFGEWRSSNIIGENHPRYNGGRKDFGENWPEIRKVAIQRDNEECQRCGISRERHLSDKNIDLDVHHKEPRRKFIESCKSIEQADEISNLITLCRSCHMKMEEI